MKKVIGWILFSVGALAVVAYIGFLTYTFVVYFKDIDTIEFQLVLFIPLIIVVPFYFVARYGWKLSHREVEIEDDRISDNSEKIMAVLEIEEKPLFFTTHRVVVAHVDGLGVNSTTAGSDFFSLASNIFSAILASSTANKVKQLSLLSPEKMLNLDLRNYAISYVHIINVQIFRKFLSRRLRITMNTTTTHQLEKSLPGGSYALEYTLCKSKLRKSLNAPRTLLPDRIEVKENKRH